MPSRIAIVGAGPAGLTAALALRRLGPEVTVFEQAEDYQRIGGGIVLHDNGQRVLQALGLLDSLRPHLQSCPVIAAELCGGRLLGTAQFSRLSPPLRHLPAIVLRYQLQEHLLAATRACGVEVRFGHRVVSASCGTPTAGSSGWRRCLEPGPTSTARRRWDAGRRPSTVAWMRGSRRGPAAT